MAPMMCPITTFQNLTVGALGWPNIRMLTVPKLPRMNGSPRACRALKKPCWTNTLEAKPKTEMPTNMPKQDHASVRLEHTRV